MYGKKGFTGIQYVKGFFALDVAPVYEIEHPFRVCKRALFIRMTKNKALVLGWWRQGSDIEKTLLSALRGKIIHDEEEKIRDYIRPETVRDDEEESISPFRS